MRDVHDDDEYMQMLKFFLLSLSVSLFLLPFFFHKQLMIMNIYIDVKILPVIIIGVVIVCLFVF